nr:transposase zinc-binding domain-containing protein [[Eubacterium] cellulosolvens]
MNTLQQIFADHYEKILYTLHPRATEIENITKMINCDDPSYGGAMYACSKCGHLKFVPFRCILVLALLVELTTLKNVQIP